jgi:hypothetical protein
LHADPPSDALYIRRAERSGQVWRNAMDPAPMINQPMINQPMIIKADAISPAQQAQMVA